MLLRELAKIAGTLEKEGNTELAAKVDAVADKLQALSFVQASQLDGPLPDLSDVTYQEPNPDGTRKKCGNCIHFVSTGYCMLHPKNLAITPESVCGYYQMGIPS